MFSFFRFGDRKCRFRDIAIHPNFFFGGTTFLKKFNQFLGHLALFFISGGWIRTVVHRLLAGPFQRVIIVRTQLIMFGIIIDCSKTSNKWISKPNSPNVAALHVQEEKPSKDDDGASMERICIEGKFKLPFALTFWAM